MGSDSNADRSKGTVATTQDVLRHHQRCIAEGDLSGLMADYASDAKFFTPDGVLHGSEAIRGFFARFLEEFAKPGRSLERLRQDVDGDTAFVVWRGETADNRYDFAADTWFVQNGKIVTQAFAAKILPKG